MKHGLGRSPSPPDSRDWNADRLLGLIKAGAAYPVTWDTPVVLDQGKTARCVGYSIATLCATAARNAPSNPRVTNALGDLIYAKAKELEGKPGDESGTYMRQGMRAAQKLGLIDHYAWGDWEQATRWVRTQGPCVVGIPWYEEMYYPDRYGVVRPRGDLDGGHAICWSMDAQTHADNGLVNTWGKGWGLNGRCYLSDIDLYQLLDRGGEAVMAVRLYEPTRPPLFVEELKTMRRKWGFR